MSHAPIALFIFNRSDHLKRTLVSLRNCKGFHASDIYVFGDGPRYPADDLAVSDARIIAKECLGENAHYRFADANKGLAESIIDGVTELTEKYGRVIVVEDDLVVSPEFLSFINASLDRYVDDERVKQVSGFNFSVPEFDGLDEALFFPMITTWGWATWRRAWREFDPEAKDWRELMSDSELRNSFNLQGAYDYTTMLQEQMLGKCDSWGIRWYWSVFRRDGIVCFPPQTLVRNIGMDGTGTHGSGLLKRFRRASNTVRDTSVQFPRKVGVRTNRWHQLKRTIWRLNGGRVGQFWSFCRRVVSSGFQSPR